MSPRTIRWLVIAVFVGGVVGMIIGSIADDNGVAITFGLLTAAAALGLILVTAVADPAAFRRDGSTGRPPATDDGGSADEAGAAVEAQVQRLTAAGADEGQLRELVRLAMTFGRRR